MLTPSRLLVFIVAGALTGCAAAVPGFSPPNARADKFHGQAPTGGGMTAEGRYVLNDQEATLDCKKINGAIHVGILQLREEASRHRPSAVAVQIQKMSSPVAPGSAYGLNPDGEAARSRARLEALNARLAEKNCPTYDLIAELKPGNTEAPTPVRSKKGR